MIKLKDILNETSKITEDDLLKKSSEEIIDSFQKSHPFSHDYDTAIQGFNNKEEAIEYLDSLKTTSFPDGLANIPSEMTLYRVLLIRRGKVIDEKEIGRHFVADTKIIYSEDWLESIGIFDMVDWDDETSQQLWLLVCKVPKSNLDLHQTIENRLRYPDEEEFTLKSPTGIRVVDKIPIDDILLDLKW